MTATITGTWTRRIASLAIAFSFITPAVAHAAPITLRAIYTPDTGNITLKSFDDATDLPAPLSVSLFQLISPAQYMSGPAAAIPASAASFATILNTQGSTFSAWDPPRVGAEVYATNFFSGTPLFTSEWDLGNIAQTGLTPTQLLNFITDPDVSPDPTGTGIFLYQIQGDTSNFYAGPVLTAVPEPSTMVMAGLAVAFLGGTAIRRRKKS
jgi:hypothetical protein